MTIAQIDMLTRNRQPHEEYAPRIRHTTLEAAVAQAKAAIQRALDADQRLAACTCGAASPAFDPTRKETPLDYRFKLERAKRTRDADALTGWDDVFATVEDHRAYGVRETPPSIEMLERTGL